MKRDLMSVGRSTAVVAAVAIALLASAGVPAQEVAGGTTTSTRPMPASPSVSQAMLDAASGDTKNWLQPNGSYEQTRYYASAHINAGNVGRIKPAFVFQAAVLESMQTAPIVVDGVMFLTTSFNHVYAIDAATGEEFWRYRHKPQPIPAGCCGNDNRGVAVAGGTLFMGTNDARLVALDARTGKVRWEQQIADPEKGLSATMAPTVVDGKVLIGADGGAHGMRGFVKAFGVADGSLLWTFHTIPDKGHEGVWAESDATGRNLRRDIAAEKRVLAEKGGEFHQSLGGGIATTPAIDRKTRTVFVAVGSPAPAFHGAIRPGDNLYTDSIVAIDLDQGTYKWHFQYIAHNVWNLGAASPPVLAQPRTRPERWSTS
jgi:PQQ-dependent dehydrogenase (methanol/ethanol family)